MLEAAKRLGTVSDRPDQQIDMRCFASNRRDYGRDDNQIAVVCCGDTELLTRGTWIELRLPRQCRAQMIQRSADRFGKGKCPRRRLHPVRRPNEESIAEESAKPGQCVAHRWLSVAYPGACASDVPFPHQGFEGDEKVEVDGS